METHHLTLQELHRQDLLDEATDARRIKDLTRTSPAETSRVQHQAVTLRQWLPQFVARLRTTPLTSRLVRS